MANAPKYITDVATAPKAIGPYSQAVDTGSFIFLSGQIPIEPETGKLIGDDIESQTRQVLKNIREVLARLGLSFANVVKSTIFLTDLGHFQTVNGLYGEALGEFKPARSTVQVAALPLGSKIEIEMIALRS